MKVKGRAEPVRVSEVQKPKAQPGRMRGLVGLESPMVGRDPELSSLMQLSAAVGAGLGRAAVVIGEPGLGKSRLIAEWKTAAQAGGAGTSRPVSGSRPAFTWAEGRCLSYGQNIPYHLLSDLLQ